MAIRKLTAQHLVLVALAVFALALVNTYVGPHWLGWGAAPAVAGNNTEVLNALQGIEKSIGSVKGDVGNLSATVAEQDKKIELLNASKTAPVVSQFAPTGVAASNGTKLVAEEPPARTNDDARLATAQTYYDRSEDFVKKADRYKSDARDAVRDEEDSDASDAKSDANDLLDDISDLREDVRDLQDSLDKEWAEDRNTTARNIASGLLDDALDNLKDAKSDANDAVSKANELLKPEVKEEAASAGQQATQAVALPKLQSAA